MATERRGLRSLKTLGSLIDGRKVRTPAGALLELSAMANEKLLLTKELDRGVRRRLAIETRLAEIHAKSARMFAFVKDPSARSITEPATVQDTAPTGAVNSATPGVNVTPLKFKVTKLSY